MMRTDDDDDDDVDNDVDRSRMAIIRTVSTKCATSCTKSAEPSSVRYCDDNNNYNYNYNNNISTLVRLGGQQKCK